MADQKRPGELIRARREELQLTRLRAAEMSGLTDQTWLDIESDVQRKYRQVTLHSIANVLRWPPTFWETLQNGGTPRTIKQPTNGRDTSQIEQLDAVLGRIEVLLAALVERFESLEEQVALLLPPPSPKPVRARRK